MPIRIPYEQCQFHFVTNHYDYHLTGTCIYNGRIANFQAVDETDYQTMTDTCPYCSGKTEELEKCHCENAPDLFVDITELNLIDRIKARLYPYKSLMTYIRNWGIQGIYYWSRWKK